MGEAKIRRKLGKQIISKCPFCIYCGGGTPATTVDHLPPIGLFTGRSRPRGLEFAACKKCNSGGRADELVAAMLSRLYPDSTTETERDEITRLMHSANKRLPGLLAEMVPSIDQIHTSQEFLEHLSPDSGVLNCNGPILNRAIHRFAAKFGFALHYQATNEIVPETGGTSVYWLTNHNAMAGEMPQELIKRMGPPATLQQGTWQVFDQFSYGSVVSTDNQVSAHLATFRFSFAVCAFTATDHSRIKPPTEVEHVTSYQPGWLMDS